MLVLGRRGLYGFEKSWPEALGASRSSRASQPGFPRGYEVYGPSPPSSRPSGEAQPGGLRDVWHEGSVHPSAIVTRASPQTPGCSGLHLTRLTSASIARTNADLRIMGARRLFLAPSGFCERQGPAQPAAASWKVLSPWEGGRGLLATFAKAASKLARSRRWICLCPPAPFRQLVDFSWADIVQDRLRRPRGAAEVAPRNNRGICARLRLASSPPSRTRGPCRDPARLGHIAISVHALSP